MRADFWHQKWADGETAFHESEVNPLLVDHLEKIDLAQGSRLFLPLCGKTRDIAWLLGRGYRVVGAELSELAINALFIELGVAPAVSTSAELTLYRAQNIDIFCGDIFDLSAELLGHVDAVYDRAALVALPERMREAYTSHLTKLTDAAPQLLITYEYDQQTMDGPPFSISEAEVKHHYANSYQLQRVLSQDIAGGLKGEVPSSETVWLLQK